MAQDLSKPYNRFCETIELKSSFNYKDFSTHLCPAVPDDSRAPGWIHHQHSVQRTEKDHKSKFKCLRYISNVIYFVFQNVQLPLDLSTLNEEERQLRLERRKPKKKVKVIEELEDSFDATSYSHFWKK